MNCLRRMSSYFLTKVPKISTNFPTRKYNPLPFNNLGPYSQRPLSYRSFSTLRQKITTDESFDTATVRDVCKGMLKKDYGSYWQFKLTGSFKNALDLEKIPDLNDSKKLFDLNRTISKSGLGDTKHLLFPSNQSKNLISKKWIQDFFDSLNNSMSHLKLITISNPGSITRSAKIVDLNINPESIKSLTVEKLFFEQLFLENVPIHKLQLKIDLSEAIEKFIDHENLVRITF